MSTPIVVEGLCKRFGSFDAVTDVTFTAPAGAVTALLGPSGSGKSTVLRMIAGLEEPTAGRIFMGDEELTVKSVQERRVGFVFQHYALFRHMTVQQNVEFGLRVRKAEVEQRRTRVADLLELVHMAPFADRYPDQLSGGQRQRVALARALAPQPSVLLLDEPFGALDAKVRKELRRWLRRLHEEVHVTSVFVTHDQEEALEVSDRVVIMNEGRVEQSGTPEEVYERPATPFVYGFLGDVNLFHGRIHRGRVNIGPGELEAPDWAEAPDQDGVAYVRTYDVELGPTPVGPSSLEAVVRHVRAFGPVVRVELDLLPGGTTVEVHLSRDRFDPATHVKGGRVFLSPTQVRVFARPM